MTRKLSQYIAKRDFKKTPEPITGSKIPSSHLNFCIQKHNASHLHYDFRLEHQGVLLSWAIPKGPSLNPEEKRLAIRVEDHPLDYQYFEGIIPKGHYGAGTVEIWDHGTYTLPNAKDKNEIEKNVLIGLKKGHLAIVLNGERLKGEYVLQKLKSDSEDKSWLLIKKADDYAIFTHEENQEPKINKKKIIIPDFLNPMLATLIDKPFDSADWLFEIKLDGFRALAYVKDKKVELKSRNNLSFNAKFPAIVKCLEKIKGEVILDGEIVILDKFGKSNFQMIQNNEEGILCYYVFDILYKDNIKLMDLPLIERKEILKKYLTQLSEPSVRYSDHILKEGKKMFKEAEKLELEGIIGKKIMSSYQTKRSADWVKIKTSKTQEVIICGFTEPKGSRQKFGALIVGIYDEQNRLCFSGHVGGGFNFETLEKVYNKLKPLIQKNCPFKTPPKVNSPVTWVKPKLIAEVSFSEWTKDQVMRIPIFRGLRNDKEPKSIKKEIPMSISVEEKKSKKLGTKQLDLALTNQDKIYWPEEKYTKGDLLAYYETIAPYIIPYLKNRPIMLHRYPNGIHDKSFYQKDLNFALPNGIETFPLQQEGKINHYLLINDLKSLLFAINLGSIDLHPFLSNTKHLENPDFCVIDLDPHDISFDKVIEVALLLHDILTKAKVKHYCKTSGGKGLHILIPLQAKYTYDQSRQFAEIICHYVHQLLPKTTSMERSPEKRPKKIYLDCLQNRKGQSIAAPYSVRPKLKATVSTPLMWEEVNLHLDISEFNIKTVPHRLHELGDIFKPCLGTAVNIQKILKFLKSFQS